MEPWEIAQQQKAALPPASDAVPASLPANSVAPAAIDPSQFKPWEWAKRQKRELAPHWEEQRRKINEEYMRQRGFVGGVDYRTGIQSPSFRAGFARMETPEERVRWLESNVGEAGHDWAYDPAERFLVSPEKAREHGIDTDKWVAIDPVTLDWGDISDFAGQHGPATAAGIAAGIATGGLGTIPAMALTGMAAGGAKAIDEGIEELQGYNEQTKGEVAVDAGLAGGTEALAEGMARAATPLFRMALGPARQPQGWYNPITSVGPVQSRVPQGRLDAARMAKEQGFLVSPAQIQGDTGGFIYPRIEAAARNLFGDPTVPLNVRAFFDNYNAIAKEAGAPTLSPDAFADSLSRMVGHLDDKAVQLGRLETQAGEQVRKDILDRAYEASQRSSYAEAMLPTSPAPYSGRRPTSREEAGEIVKQRLRSERQEFSRAADARLSEWQRQNDGVFLDASSVIDVADDFLNRGVVRTVKNEEGEEVAARISGLNQEAQEFVKQIAKMDPEQAAVDMHALRKTLREKAWNPDVLPSVPQHVAAKMLRAVDGAMETTGLREFNQWYREGISRFDDAEVLRIARDTSAGGSLKPERIADFVIAPGKTTLPKQVRELIGEDAWQDVLSAHYRGMLDDVTVAGKVDTRQLAARVRRLGPSLESAYGRDGAARIRRYADELSLREGSASANVLAGADKNLLSALSRRKAQVDGETALLKSRFVEHVRSGAYNPDRLVDVLMQPNNQSLVAEARTILGKDSDAWRGIQGAVAGRLLQSGYNTKGQFGDYLQPQITATGVKDAFDKLHRLQAEEILGPQLAQRIDAFGRSVALSMTRPSMRGGQLMTAAMALHPINNLGRVAQFKILERMLLNPKFIKWMTEGYSAPKARFLARQLGRVASRVATSPGLGQGELEQVSDEFLGFIEEQTGVRDGR